MTLAGRRTNYRLSKFGAGMRKHIYLGWVLASGLFSISAAALAADSSVPAPFQGFDENSRLTIDYRDLDSLLDAVVLNTGRSDRKKAKSTQSPTGTRMKVKINRSTINEGNRFFFEVFHSNPENQQTLGRIHNRLQNIPGFTPLDKYSREEQLAYWLNLYNTTMLVEILKAYPRPELESLLVGEESILSKQTLMVAGVPLSLNDIEYTILKQNYDSDPLIIYGLYQGIIGGPNIRKSAYTGRYVYADLIDNAVEFINSNRGTESRNDEVFRVSSLYQRNAAFFPDFNDDLKVHLLTYLEGDERDELRNATVIEADIDDWTVTDLYGSTQTVGGSFATSNAALGGSVAGRTSSRATGKTAVTSKYSPEVLQHLAELNQKKEREKTGVVTVEEAGTTADDHEPADDAGDSR